MGWSITPTDNVTATTEDGKYKVIFGSRDGLPTTAYTIQYEEGSSCGKFVVKQTGNAEPPQPSGLGNVYMNFELRNNTGQDIYSIPKIKLWVAKPPYIGLFYIQKKDWVDRDCSDFEIPPYDPNHPVTLSYMDLAFVGESRIQDTESDPDHWITLDEPASFMNNGMLLQSGNNQEPYLYTYINGSNVPSNQRIKVFLVNPETGEKLPLGGSLNFSAGTESEQANYILDISLKEGASGTINSCT